MRSNILGLFVNKLNSDDKDTLLNGTNLMQRIQMQISKKQKIFAEFFSGFPKSRSNFQNFEKNDDHHSLSISEITGCKKRGWANV